jgi:hypothetical protein
LQRTQSSEGPTKLSRDGEEISGDSPTAVRSRRGSCPAEHNDVQKGGTRRRHGIPPDEVKADLRPQGCDRLKHRLDLRQLQIAAQSAGQEYCTRLRPNGGEITQGTDYCASGRVGHGHKG